MIRGTLRGEYRSGAGPAAVVSTGKLGIRWGGALVQVDAFVRLFRSVLVTACVVSLGAGAHVTGGGSLPHPALLAALTVLALVPVTLLAGRRLSLPVIGGVLAGGQFVLHSAFEMFSAGASCAPVSGSAWAHVHAGMDHAARLSSCLPAGSSPMIPHMLDAGASLGMVVAHVLATTATALLLARGEGAFWHVVAWLRPLAVLPTVVPVTGWPQAPGFEDDIWVPAAWRTVNADPQRGPPARLFIEAAPR